MRYTKKSKRFIVLGRSYSMIQYNVFLQNTKTILELLIYFSILTLILTLNLSFIFSLKIYP